MTSRRGVSSPSKGIHYSNRPGKAPVGRKEERTPNEPSREGMFPIEYIDRHTPQTYYVVWITDQRDVTSGGTQFDVKIEGLYQDRNTANEYVRQRYFSQSSGFTRFNTISDSNGCIQVKVHSDDGSAILHIKVTAIHCSPRSTDVSERITPLPLPGT